LNFGIEKKGRRISGGPAKSICFKFFPYSCREFKGIQRTSLIRVRVKLEGQ